MHIEKLLMAIWLFVVVAWQTYDFLLCCFFSLFHLSNQVEEITNIQSFDEQVQGLDSGIPNRGKPMS